MTQVKSSVLHCEGKRVTQGSETRQLDKALGLGGGRTCNRDAYYYEQKVQSSHTNVTAVPVTMFAFGYWKKEIGHGQN